MTRGLYVRESDGHVLLRLLVEAPAYDPVVERRGQRYVLVGEIEDAWPTDRTFRDAWEHQSGRVVVNMSKARAVHMGRVRVARDQALVALDAPFLRAVEEGDVPEQRRIAAEKKRLRDLPATFDLSGAATPEALAALWPDGLPR